METMGWYVEKFGRNAVNQGFLGMKMWEADMAALKAGQKGLLRTAGSMAFRTLPMVSTAYFMIDAYQREGVWGATKEFGYGAAMTSAFHYAGALLGGAALPVAGVAALGAAAVGGAYVLGEAGRQHMKGLRQLEMGQQDQMQAAIGSAGAATMRQRSLAALNNTHLNGRSALGQEGFLLHRSFV